jgi:ribosome recycling factor
MIKYKNLIALSLLVSITLPFCVLAEGTTTPKQNFVQERKEIQEQAREKIKEIKTEVKDQIKEGREE